MITIFSAPKPFTDPHISLIQQNAIRSWVQIGKDISVILLGDEEGVAEVAKQFHILHVKDVQVNEKGTPLISSMLELTCEKSDSPYLAIVNTDILLFPDILEVTKGIASKYKQFVIAGQRWDIKIKAPLQENKNFFGDLRQRVFSQGVLHPPMGSDYFIFPRTCYATIPDFAIGRAGWDNWMIYKARHAGWPVIDASADLLIAHQEHGYGHFADGKPHYRQPETQENVRLAGGVHTIYTLFDAQYLTRKFQVKRVPWSPKKIFRELEILPVTVFRSDTLGKAFYWLWRPKKAITEMYNAIRKRTGRAG